MSDLNEREGQHDLELLAGAVLGDQTAEETVAIERRATSVEYQQILWELEMAAAAVQLIFARESSSAEMPEGLRHRILADAPSHLVTSTQAAFDSSKAIPTDDRAARRSLEDNLKTPVTPEPPGSLLRITRESVAWFVCAASVILALGLWWSKETVVTEVPLAEARQELLNEANDVLQVEWSAGKTPFPTEVAGDVVWSNATQTGYMRFVGMPVNQPSVEQYQLWIIDPQRDEEPIDGGVFDIGADGEVIVPIDAKLRVIQPAAFAITIEKPGGVVVSTQERLPLLAAVN